MPTSPLTTIHVDMNGRGLWEIRVRRSVRTVCGHLEEAQRAARLQATRYRPSQVIVRDAYRRVCAWELIGDVEQAAAPYGATAGSQGRTPGV